MRIALGNDHAGLPLKAAVIDELQRLGHTVEDLGTNAKESVDFPDFAGLVGSALQTARADRGPSPYRLADPYRRDVGAGDRRPHPVHSRGRCAE